MHESDTNRCQILHLLVDVEQRSLARVLWGALAILVVSAAAGLVVNHFSSHRLPIFLQQQEREDASLPLPPGVGPMDPGRAYSAFQQESALFLDARRSEEYAQGHIPGALSLPAREFDERYLDLVDRIESAPALVVYCQSMECLEGFELADRLRELVRQPIYLFEEGWQVWRAAGYPVEKERSP